MDGKSRSYMRAVCAVLAAGLLTAGCGKEETAAAETAEIAVPEAAKRAEGSETTASAEFFQSLKIRCLYFQAVFKLKHVGAIAKLPSIEELKTIYNI